MNEPLITLHETEDGRAVRRFADGDATHQSRTQPAPPARTGFGRLARR